MSDDGPDGWYNPDNGRWDARQPVVRDRAATALEAYVTGVVTASLTTPRQLLPPHLHVYAQTNDEGLITGAIEIHDRDGNIRATVLITETVMP